MSSTKLVKTILCHGDNKYEVYATSEYADVDRIIHYKLRSCKNTDGSDGKSESIWLVYDPAVRLPQDPKYKKVSNIDPYLEERR
ncbi:hypothetical protein ACNFMA_004070 [Escherichia coli]|uniref:Uncharacterized protein n=2 Tax=Shigella TaxID=620 RepID=A0A1S9JCC0_SHIBO|nr:MULTISPECIES: hypothetical protein [Enterobacteriaceae]EGD7153633.1 hypothetical protein [Shigella dysenteriae]EFB9251057.1 hypothetical protein [Escherichia coli]EFC6290236.1 hypothetical protein [Escherichia coli]EFF9496556.1 hypothetical protein [Escherichia coli]EFH5808778.1 hypothetical protein [Escherichia coli]